MREIAAVPVPRPWQQTPIGGCEGDWLAEFPGSPRAALHDHATVQQRDRDRTRVVDQDAWRAYLGGAEDDARMWVEDLAVRVDTNVSDARGSWGILLDHVMSQPLDTRIADLNATLVEFCMRKICGEGVKA